ncbi:MAG: aminotransferase class IV [Terrimicrobiaceae bacterium]|nr:aminotransferase class IV [Terrimicrobiaceae bacterium]
MSFFETIAVRRGRALFLGAHAERLERASGVPGAWSGAVEDLCHGLEDGLLRVYVTAGPGGTTDAFSGDTYVLFEASDTGPMSPARIISVAAPYFPAVGGWKTGNYWQNVAARAEAARAGADEALLFNPAGALVSASMANVFLKVDGMWKTPVLETGARDGVVRAWVLASGGVDVTLLGPDDVAHCESCVVTNSRTGPRAVFELDGRALDVSEPWSAEYREEVLGL